LKKLTLALLFAILVLLLVPFQEIQADSQKWTKYSGNPILSPGPRGSWDDYSVSHPTVLKVGSTYMMWYTGNNRIGLATSSDGTTWTKHPNNPVLNVGSSRSWDDKGVFAPSVILVGSTFYMYYSGKSSGISTSIGLAVSTDGVSWTRSTANPILTPGPMGSWDSSDIHSPSVLKVDSSYYMWYTSSVGQPGITGFIRGRIGLATSTDGVSWTKYPENPVLTPDTDSWDHTHTFAPSVLKLNSTYYMWYSGVTKDAVWKIGLATSADGVSWRKFSENPILTPGTAEYWDSGSQGVQYAKVLAVNSSLYMYYMGDTGSGRFSIGLATMLIPGPTAWQIGFTTPLIQREILTSVIIGVATVAAIGIFIATHGRTSRVKVEQPPTVLHTPESFVQITQPQHRPTIDLKTRESVDKIVGIIRGYDDRNSKDFDLHFDNVYKVADKIAKRVAHDMDISAYDYPDEIRRKVIYAIFRFVRDKIRPHGEAEEIVRSPSIILKMKEGLCYNKAVLLSTLLKRIGFYTQLEILPPFGDRPGHVFVSVSLNKELTEWLDLDPSSELNEPGQIKSEFREIRDKFYSYRTFSE